MKIKLLFSIMFFLGFFGSISADPIDTTLAKTVAKNLYWGRVPVVKGISYSDIKPQLIHIRHEQSNNIYYVFDFGDNNGFVIISADDDAYPILGYSFEGTYKNENQPLAFIDWMNHYKEQILYIRENNLKADKKITNEWSKLQTFNPTPKALKSVEPLLKEIAWGQGKYYNSSCPVDARGPDGRAKVGCVAVAMGQVMKYHSHPTVGTDYWEYDHTIVNGYSNDYGPLPANFGATTYNWSNMPDNASTYDSDLATLLYHCGVSVEMNYGPSLSSASTSKVDDALENYFGYDLSAQYIIKTDETQWKNDLKNELDASRPIVYRGSNSEGDGHAFVCDGYLGNEFHFNWGWNGSSSDGYYYLEDLHPLILFPYNQAAVFGIKPYIPGSSPPTLLNPRVEPLLGTESTNFKFSVDYYDADGEVPISSEAKLSLFGPEYKTILMNLESGTADNGTYTCVTNLPLGSYSHRFAFLNASNQYAVTDILEGPSVYNSSNITIIPHLDCGVDETYEIELRYKVNDNPYKEILLKVGENDGFEVPPAASLSLSLSTKENYTFDKYEFIKNGIVEREYGSSGTIVYFTDYASGIYELHINLSYTPQNLIVSGTINNENNTPYTGLINLNIVSSQQDLSISTSDGIFSFNNVKGGVPIKVEASGAPLGYAINPGIIPVTNLWRDETDLRFTVSADDFIAPTIQLIHYPDLQSSLSDITFSWIGEDDVSIEDSLKYSYQLVGFDVSPSPLSNAKTVNYSLPNGTYKFIVKAWDEAGNSSNVPVEYSFVVNANPKIDNIEKFEKSLWASKIIISTDGSTISENRIVLLPEHSLTNIESIIPVRLYRLNETKSCGSNQIIAGTLNQDTVFVTQGDAFIFNIPDEFPESNKLEYIIEWGKKCNFGWQESKSIPKGFPNLTKRGLFNCDITEDKYLDENYNLWRLATMNKKITTDDQNINNSWTYFDKANTNEVLINEREIEYIEGSWVSGERYSWLECSRAKLIPILDKQYIVIEERNDERTYPEGTFLDLSYERYVIKAIGQNGSLIHSLYGEWNDYYLYPLPEFSINNNIWITAIKKEYNQGEYYHALYFTIIDENCNVLADNVEFFRSDISQDVDNKGVYPIGSNKAIIFFEDEYKTALKKYRENLCFQIRGIDGTLEKATSFINPLLDESIDVNDIYDFNEIIPDNLGRVWISYNHYRSGDGDKFYYVVLDANGQTIRGPIQTEIEREFLICDRDGYVWAYERDSVYLTDPIFNETAFPKSGIIYPNQKVGDKMARVLYYNYALFDRWSPITFAVDLSGNHRNDTLEIFDLPINQDVGVRNFTLELNNTNLLNSTILPESSKLKVGEKLQLGTNVFTMAQDHLIGGNVLVTFPLVVNYPPIVNNSITDKVIMEDYGDSVLVDNLNLVFDDQNGDTLTYSISFSGNSITISVIDSVIQVTTINNMFGLNEVVVTASDGTHSIRDTFNIEVTPVNDTPVVNDQVFSIKENSPNGTIVDTVLATDADVNDLLSYTITNGNTGNAFAINAFTGEIVVNDSSQLDYETDSTFVLTVQVQDNGTGYLTDDATITINLINEVETSLEEVKSNDFIKIYPNPAKDLLVIKIDGDQQNFSQVIIYDLHGKILIKQKINGLNNQNEYDININSLSSGFYYISLDFGKTRIVRNFTVVR